MSWKTVNGKLVQTNAYGQPVDRSAAAKKAAETRKRNDARCLKCYGRGHGDYCKCDHGYYSHSRSYRNPDAHRTVTGCTCEALDFPPCQECEGTGKRLTEWVNPLKVGDILQGSWGYDQTNIDFYQVIEATRRMVTIVELAAFNAKGNGYSNHVYPAKDQFVGEPLKRLVSRSGSVHVEEWGRWLSKWDGSGKYETDAMAGH